MQTKQHTSTKKPARNPLEILSDTASDTAKQTVRSLGQIGSGAFDQLMGNYFHEQQGHEGGMQHTGEEHKSQPKKEHKPLFNFHEHHETHDRQVEIQQLMTQIKQEIDAIKKSNTDMISQVKDIENITINDHGKQDDEYHISFLGVVLSFLRTLRLKIGSSQTWLEAMMSKKKKRGSLFASRSKKQGTAYSLSQELQVTRSVQ